MKTNLAAILGSENLNRKRSFNITENMDNAINLIAEKAQISPSNVIRNALRIAIPMMLAEIGEKPPNNYLDQGRFL